MTGKSRFVHGLLVALGVAYTVAGIVFLSTGNVGGISLGLLFLGGAALLYLGVQLLNSLQRLRQLLAQHVAAEQHQAVRAPLDKPP